MLTVFLVKLALADNWWGLDNSFAEMVVVPEDLLLTYGDVVFGTSKG